MTAVSGTDQPPGRVLLTGADCFLRAFDSEIARFNDSSHVSQLVLRLGPGFDLEAFRELVVEAARAQPMLRAPVRRRLWVGAPIYDLAAAATRPLPGFEVHDVPEPARDGDPLPAVFARRINERRSLRRGQLLHFDVVRYDRGAAGCDVAMSWPHLLFDGSGSERFIRWLDGCYRGQHGLDELPVPDELTAAPAARRSLRERGDAARAWQRWVDGFGAHPVQSLAGPRRHTPQALAYDVLRLSRAETEYCEAQAGRLAGFLTPMLFYMAAAIRAHHAVARARGFDPVSYLVPLPVNLRPRSAEGAIFRTHVSLIWFQVLPEQVEDLPGLIAELKAQRLAAIKAGQVENGVDAMDFARHAPARLYVRMARAASPGELCSFFFAYTGEMLAGLDSFLGGGIANAFHVAPVPPSPGSCVAMSRRDARLNVTHVHQRGVFSDSERELLHAALRADLGGGA